MKKSLIALALASAFTSAAYAQSSVTLYGLIDETLHRQTHTNALGQSVLGLDEGAWQGSRFGLKGSEDLGGGTSAVFQMEGGVAVFNGQSDQQGQLFGRQAYVGLSNPVGGKLTAGRQYDALFQIMGDYDPLGWGNWSQNSWQLKITGVRYDNTIIYQNNFNGSPVNILLQYSPGGQAGSTSNGTTYGGGATINVAPVKFGLVLQDSKEAQPPSTTQLKKQTYGVGATGTFSIVTPYLSYIHDKKDPGFAKAANLSGGPLANTSLAGNSDTVTRTDKVITLGVGLQFTPAFVLTLGGMQDKVNRSISYSERTIYLNGDYFLSKRTDVYAEFDANHIGNSTAGALGVIGTGYSSSTDYGIGIRHRF